MGKITPKKAVDLGNSRAEEIDALLTAFERLIEHNAGLLTESLIKGFVDKLEAKNGLILNNSQNLKKIQLLDQAYSMFANTEGVKIATALLDDMEGIMLLNDKYFEELRGGRKVDSSDLKTIIRQRLGITAEGELVRDGYMMGLLQDNTVRNEIREFAYSRVMGGTGFQDFRKGLKTLIEGDGEKLGAFKRFYRNYAFDTYAQVDAMNGALYAEKLKLKYFIYNGGILKDKKGKVRSRKFCIERAGKVYSSAEADKWKNDPDLTAVDDKATYVWQIQRGGHACRHSIDWISEEIAFAMRPELEKAA